MSAAASSQSGRANRQSRLWCSRNSAIPAKNDQSTRAPPFQKAGHSAPPLSVPALAATKATSASPSSIVAPSSLLPSRGASRTKSRFAASSHISDQAGNSAGNKAAVSLVSSAGPGRKKRLAPSARGHRGDDGGR